MNSLHVTTTELKENMKAYLELAETQDIVVTKNGKETVVITSIKSHHYKNIRALKGIAEDTGQTRESIRAERLARYEDND